MQSMAETDALENLKSPTFKAAVALEDTLWSHALTTLPEKERRNWIQDTATYSRSAWPTADRKWAHVEFEWAGRPVSIQHSGAGYTENVWIGEWSRQGLSGIGFSENNRPIFYTLEDVGNGAEQLELTIWTFPHDETKKPRRLWSRVPVGPSVAIQGDRIYFSTVENMLRYPDVCSVNLADGNGFKQHYIQVDKRIQVTIVQRNHDLFVQEANAIFQRVGKLKDGHISWMTNVLKSTVIPVTSNMYLTDQCMVILPDGKHESRRECWELPTNHHAVDAARLHGSLFVVTVQDGAEYLWVITESDWICLWRPDQRGHLSAIQIQHELTKYPTFLVRTPDASDCLMEFRIDKHGVGKLVERLQYPTPLTVHTVLFGTAGAAGIPYQVVSHVKRPKKVLVEAYGAYGISARRAYPVRWLPYLARGYAIAYICPRGGREKGDAWWDGGRTALRKQHTFEDTATAIEVLQKRLRLGRENTVFFGRSAGGWLAAVIAQKYQHLVAAVYAEVPYVDVLATTSNPALPLTQLEYDEFGDPLHRPEEKRALAAISPVDTVPLGSPTSPLLVIRTGLNDAQVLPYEALKWAAELRKKGWGRVFVGIDHGGGHFAGEDVVDIQRAEDGALLDQAVSSATATAARRHER